MNPQDPNENQPMTMPQEQEISSSPASAPVDPAPNMPPADLLTNAPVDPATEAPAPPPSTPVTNTVSSGGGKLPKTLLFIVLGVLLFAVGAFAVVRFVLPNLGGVVGGKTELVWWGLWEDDGIIQPLIEEYEAANPNVTITYVKNSKEDYRERLANSLARGDGPDIFRFHNSWAPMFAGDLSTIPTSVMSAQEFQNTFYPVASDDLIGNEGPVGVPLMYDGLAMFINEEIFTTYGKTIPRDWNELRETARALTIKDEREVITQAGASLGTTSNVDHWPEIVGLLMLQNGADPEHPNDTAGRGEQALKFYNQFAKTDQIWDDTQPNSTIAFATGRVAMYIGPSWRAFEIRDRNPALKFRVESVPQVPKEDPTAPDITYASYWAEGVWDESTGKDEAWKFLKYLSEKEQLTMLYENSAQARLFGEPYPRPDMRELLLPDPIVGGFMELANSAKSSYLYSRTFDGASGINTSLTDYYEDTLGSISQGKASTREMSTLAIGVQQVLSRYGLAPPIPVEE
jgi:multiple sugar transport system substrate-binding protein